MCSSGRAETLAKGAELAVVPVRTRPAPPAREPRDVDARAGGVQPVRDDRRRGAHPARQSGRVERVRDALMARPRTDTDEEHHVDTSSNAVSSCAAVHAAGPRHRGSPGNPAARPRGARRLEPEGPGAGRSGRLDPSGRGGLRHGEQADDSGRAAPPGATGRDRRRCRSAVRLVAQQRVPRHRVPVGKP